MKSVILIVLFAFSSAFFADDAEAQDVLGGNSREQKTLTAQTLYLIDADELGLSARPLISAGDYALIWESDIPHEATSHSAILPDRPGDYYLMRVFSPADLRPVDGKIPYVLMDDNAIFRTDAEGAATLPNYGFGLTRLTAVDVVREPFSPPSPPTKTEYDPDIAEMIANITPELCELTLTDLTSFPTRYSYTEGCRNAEQYVYEQFDGLSLNTSFHDFSYAGYDMRNVIGEMTGTTRPDSVIIVCGHLDCTSGSPWSNAPGAEDNGSGSAAVIEAARVLSQYQTDLTIRFITFSGEEQGLIGSDYYSELMVSIGEDIGGVLNLDMVAYQGPYAYDMHVSSDNLSHWLGDLALQTLDDYTPIVGVDDYTYNPAYGSDHYYFALRGYPAIFFIDAWSGPDWYPYYHSTNDVIAHLNMDLLADITRTGAALAAILARVDFEGSDCVYVPGDCDGNDTSRELTDIIAMITYYRGQIPEYSCECPPDHPEYYPRADADGDCLAFELEDVVKTIAAYRGPEPLSGCPDCPGDGRLLTGKDQPIMIPSLKTRTKIGDGRAAE